MITKGWIKILVNFQGSSNHDHLKYLVVKCKKWLKCLLFMFLSQLNYESNKESNNKNNLKGMI